MCRKPPFALTHKQFSKDIQNAAYCLGEILHLQNPEEESIFTLNTRYTYLLAILTDSSENFSTSSLILKPCWSKECKPISSWNKWKCSLPEYLKFVKYGQQESIRCLA